MATIDAQIQCRLRLSARVLLYVATLSARIGFSIPHPLIVAVTNRCWQMRIGSGAWFGIRIDNQGRRIA